MELRPAEVSSALVAVVMVLIVRTGTTTARVRRMACVKCERAAEEASLVPFDSVIKEGMVGSQWNRRRTPSLTLLTYVVYRVPADGRCNREAVQEHWKAAHLVLPLPMGRGGPCFVHYYRFALMKFIGTTVVMGTED